MSNSAHDASTASNSDTPLPTKQPAGLWVLFITEMWERFSYYGMRALLVLYLIQSTGPMLDDGTENTNPGFGWEKADAFTLYGIYTAAVYLTPLVGGWLADRFLGTHRSMLVGGWIIVAGHITLALTEFFGITAGEAVTLQTGPGALLCFFTGLGLIIVGTGFFKPCVSVMVGQLYGSDDARRDSGFTIFYMGINVGAFLSPLIAGTLGETVGWHWGFGSAAVGMLAGLFFYQIYRPRYLQGVGDPPEEKGSLSLLAKGAAVIIALAGIAVLIGYYVLPWLRNMGWEPVFWSALMLFGLVAVGAFVMMQEPRERGPLGVIFVLAFLGNIFFWTAFEQAGSSLNVFAKDQTDRTLGGLLEAGGALGGLFEGGVFPASWYQSVNPLAIVVFGPVFAWLWRWLDARKSNPSTPMKFAWGLYLLGLAFLSMICAAFQTENGELAGAHWLLITFVIVTWGELCLSPVGLSMVTKLTPPRLQSLMMGMWFFSFSLSNLFAGFVAAFSRKLEDGSWTFIFPGLPGFFLMLVVVPLGAGVVLTLLCPILKRMMHGVH